jgi:hypothetical protein
MAQKIIRLCDPCQADGEDNADAAPVVVSLGAGFRALDLCPTHAAQILKPVADALEAFGVRVDGPQTARKTTRGAGYRPPMSGPVAAARRVEGVADPSLRHLCPACAYGANAESAVRRHIQQVHGPRLTPITLADFTCPLCGERHQGRGKGSLIAHLADVHAQPSIGHAVHAADADGDPYGVAAAVRERAAAAGAP